MDDKINQVIFLVPNLPPSVNIIYEPKRPSIHSNKPQWGLRQVWREWGSKHQQYVRRLTIAPDSFVRCDIFAYYQFFWSNGKLREVDTHNLVKFLIDVIAVKQEWTDKVTKFGSWGSADDKDNPRVVVRLTEMPVMRKEQR